MLFVHRCVHPARRLRATFHAAAEIAILHPIFRALVAFKQHNRNNEIRCRKRFLIANEIASLYDFFICCARDDYTWTIRNAFQLFKAEKEKIAIDDYWLKIIQLNSGIICIHISHNCFPLEIFLCWNNYIFFNRYLRILSLPSIYRHHLSWNIMLNLHFSKVFYLKYRYNIYYLSLAIIFLTLITTGFVRIPSLLYLWRYFNW